MSGRLWPILASSALISGLCCACAPFHCAPRRAAPFPVSDDKDIQSLQEALENSLRYLERPGLRESEAPDGLKLPVRRLLATLRDFKAALARWGLSPELQRYLMQHYEFYESGILLTAYFTPQLRGSRRPSPRYRHPLYLPPPDLNASAGPYYTREEIDYHGALAQRSLAWLWVDDPIELYFLHVQGSGSVQLEDGTLIRVEYAADNGHAYRSIGKLLAREHGLAAEEVSMQRITRLLREEPDAIRRVFSHNPRYIFFREAPQGVRGSLGVPLTAERSAAADPLYWPPAGIAVLSSEQPRFDSAGVLQAWQPFMRLVFFHDSGAAIKGRRRLDLFMGGGSSAALAAGHMNRPGRLYLLLKRM